MPNDRIKAIDLTSQGAAVFNGILAAFKIGIAASGCWQGYCACSRARPRKVVVIGRHGVSSRGKAFVRKPNTAGHGKLAARRGGANAKIARLAVSGLRNTGAKQQCCGNGKQFFHGCIF